MSFIGDQFRKAIFVAAVQHTEKFGRFQKRISQLTDPCGPLHGEWPSTAMVPIESYIQVSVVFRFHEVWQHFFV